MTLPPSAWCGLMWNTNHLSSTKLDQLSILTTVPAPLPPAPRCDLRTPSPSTTAPGPSPPEPHPATAVAGDPCSVTGGRLPGEAPLSFIALTETKRTSMTHDGKYASPVKLHGYQLEYQPANRTGVGDASHEGLSGGLILFIHSSISFVRVPSLCNPHCLFIKIGFPGSRTHTLLGVVYRRAADPNSFSIIKKTIASALMFEIPVLVTGDFNSRHTSWCSKTNTTGSQLNEFCITADLTVLNERFATLPRQPTWRGKDGISSTIDLALTSDPELFASLTAMPDLLLSSDHVPLLLTSACASPTSPSTTPDPLKPVHYRWTLNALTGPCSSSSKKMQHLRCLMHYATSNRMRHSPHLN